MRRILAFLTLAVLAISICTQCVFAGKAHAAKAPTAGAASSAAAAASLSNLKNLGLATLMYLQDNDGVYPPMKSVSKLKGILDPYIRNRSIWTNPITKQPYKANPWLSGRKEARIASPTSVVVFYEATPAGDGTRGAVFADGHAKRMPESAWPKVKAASKIP